MNALAWLNTLRPAIPMSIERPSTAMSNGELRRHIQQGGVLINGERFTNNTAPLMRGFSFLEH